MKELNKLKSNFKDWLTDMGIKEDSLSFIRDISMEELCAMDYFEGNSSVKPKDLKILQKKFDSGNYHNHCDFCASKVLCVELNSNIGKICLSKKIYNMHLLNIWEYSFPKGVTEDHLLHVIATGDHFSNSKINKSISDFFKS